MTKPYEGPAGGLGSQSDAASESFAQNRAGKATFKIKQEDSKEAGSTAGDGKEGAAAAGADDKDKVAQTGRMLRNEEIKEICEKHALKRNEVYQIRSQFASMCSMSEQYMANLEQEKQTAGLPPDQIKKQMKTPRSYLPPSNAD